MTICQACNYDRNPSGVQFCEACGTELSEKPLLVSPSILPRNPPESETGETRNIYPPPPAPIYSKPTSIQSSPPPIHPEATNNNIPPPTMARLIPKQAGAPVPEFILDSSSAIIGQFDPDTGPVEVDLEGFYGSQTVSRNHGEIYLEEGQWQIRDFNSINGIYIKPAGQTRFGPKITTPSRLNSGDEIAIGKVRLLFQIVSK